MSAISDQVLAIARPYLGPAAESFLSRQCKSHLKINFPEITRAQAKDLSKWVEIGAGLIMDGNKATELARKVAAV